MLLDRVPHPSLQSNQAEHTSFTHTTLTMTVAMDDSGDHLTQLPLEVLWIGQTDHLAKTVHNIHAHVNRSLIAPHRVLEFLVSLLH